jgi:hypothetical protein
MGTYSDFRTRAGLTTDEQASFAHGLGATPDYVVIEFSGTNFISTAPYSVLAQKDATGVTLRAVLPAGAATLITPNMTVATIVAHSIVT